MYLGNKMQIISHPLCTPIIFTKWRTVKWSQLRKSAQECCHWGAPLHILFRAVYYRQTGNSISILLVTSRKKGRTWGGSISFTDREDRRKWHASRLIEPTSWPPCSGREGHRKSSVYLGDIPFSQAGNTDVSFFFLSLTFFSSRPLFVTRKERNR